MKAPLLILAGLTALIAQSALAADVGVSVQMGQPGFYGRIDIGRFPQPMVINPQPVIIQSAPVAMAAQPLYLRVPPGHARHWGKHCARYRACGQPVYFVQDQWYQNQVVAHSRAAPVVRPAPPMMMPNEGYGRPQSAERGHGHGHGRGHERRD